MPSVIVASTNPAKIQAVRDAFRTVLSSQNIQLEFHGISVDSGVPDQPMSDIETRQGARNRAEAARAAQPEADFWVGLEAGIEESHTFAWMCIQGYQDQAITTGEARSASLPLPPKALSLIKAGAELGEAMDTIFNDKNIKQKGGAIGVLTNHKLTRASVYTQALILAFIPFINKNLF